MVGRFCHKCGQENIQPKESFWHLLQHLIAHEFHYDGKFIVTVKDLIGKPGFLTHEYFRGKRASYLDPIRMYIFISAFFFLVTFSMFKADHKEHAKEDKHSAQELTLKQKLDIIKESLADSVNDDSEKTKTIDHTTNEKTRDTENLSNKKNKIEINWNSDKKTGPFKLKIDKGHDQKSKLAWGSRTYGGLREYDSLQAKLPKAERDNFLSAFLVRRFLEKMEEFEEHPDEVLRQIGGELLHSVSEILFISLPFFALILQLLYIREKKTYYYVNHFIYTLHLYSSAFIFLLLIFIVYKLMEVSHQEWPGLAIIGIFGYWLRYSYKAMRTYYGQGRGKTLTKYWLLNIGSTILMFSLFLFFVLFAALFE